MTEQVTANGSLNASENGVNTGNDPGDVAEMDRLLRIIIPVVSAIIMLLGISGNGAVIYTGFRRKGTFRNVNKTLVTVLAFVDLTFLVVCVPFVACTYIWTVWYFGRTWCKVSSYVIYVSATLSSGVLALMSVDRFLAIVYPLSSMRMRRTRNVWIVLLLICVVSCGAYIPAIFLFDVVEYTYQGEDMSTCAEILSVSYEAGMNLRRIHYLTFAIAGYVIPLSLIVAMYGRICVTLINRNSNSGLQQGVRRNAANTKAMKFVFIIVLTFFLCWTPVQISLFLVKVVDYFQRPFPITFIAANIAPQYLAYSNSCMNPVLYTCMSSKCRRRLHDCSLCPVDNGRQRSTLDMTVPNISATVTTVETSRQE